MTARACPGCGASLARDQRYCLECGLRQGAPFEVVATDAPGVDPMRRRGVRPSAAWAGAGLLTALLVGTALGPVVTGGAAGTGRAREIVLDAPATTPAGGELTAPPTSALAALQAPTGNAPAASGGGGGGGGQSEPVSSSTQGSAASAPIPEDSTPLIPAPASTEADPGEETPADTSEHIAVKGTVVHLNPGAHGYVLATALGQLIPVHASGKPPAVGKALKVKVKKLANGTFGQASDPALGAAKTDVILQGTVTFADAADHVYTLSARGASLAVHVPADAATPALGAQLTAHATVTQRLDQTSMEATGQATGAVDHEGTVQSLDPAAKTLTLSADDTRESEHDIVVSVPAAIDVSKLKATDLIDATVTIAPDGSYTLAGFSRDDDGKAADDLSTAQGDQRS